MGNEPNYKNITDQKVAFKCMKYVPFYLYEEKYTLNLTVITFFSHCTDKKKTSKAYNTLLARPAHILLMGTQNVTTLGGWKGFGNI